MDMLSFNLVATKPGGEIQGAGVSSASPGASEGFAASLSALYHLGLLFTTEDGQTTENADPNFPLSPLGLIEEEHPGGTGTTDPSLQKGFNPLSVLANGTSHVFLKHPSAPDSPFPGKPSDTPPGIQLVANNGLGPFGVRTPGQNPGEGIAAQARGQGLGDGNPFGGEQGIPSQHLGKVSGHGETGPHNNEAIPITGVPNGLKARLLGNTALSTSPLRPGVSQTEAGTPSDKLLPSFPPPTRTRKHETGW